MAPLVLALEACLINTLMKHLFTVFGRIFRKRSSALNAAIWTLIFLISFNITSGSETQSPKDEPLILELQIRPSGLKRIEILISEDKPFHVISYVNEARYIVDGEIKQITNGIAFVNLEVEVSGLCGNSSSHRSRYKYELKINELKGGLFKSFGTRYLSIGSVWLRSGLDPRPILIKQLDGEAELALAAAEYLGLYCCDTNRALTVLEELQNHEDLNIKMAAEAAISYIKHRTQ